MAARTWLIFACMGSAIAAGCGTSREPQPVAPRTPRPAPTGTSTMPAAPGPHAASAGVEVLLCDGKTTVQVPPGTPGTTVAGALMTEWLRKNPNTTWEAEERERHTLQPAEDNSALVGQVHGQTYGMVTPQDAALWKIEAERVATAGSRVFHSADELGSTVAVSCDMCHPHAANTHPETYPKFQPQIGRVALLRDMINWCIEHPVRAKPLASEDPRMRALEAYILAQRRGTPLGYGKR
jgi:thiosulfate dehydrogenase